MASERERLPPIRVLVVDDSAFTRRSIADVLRADRSVEVVGKAADGEEALRLVKILTPDLITVDLEMPRMDGFTFLRILASTMPTPVIVVSSYSQKENVFRALELGALDFVAKPERFTRGGAEDFSRELIGKAQLVRKLRGLSFPRAGAPAEDPQVARERRLDRITMPAPPQPTAPVETVIAIASSTGGPTALMELFSRLSERFRGTILVAQHMPEKFTRTFAERLDRRSPLTVREARDQDQPVPGSAFVCPGRHSMELERSAEGSLLLRVRPRDINDRYVPSADRLLRSVAKAVGAHGVGVVLTGMGDDGALGALAIKEAGGIVIAESEDSAVVYGMPAAAVRAGAVARSLPLRDIADYVALVGS